MYEFKRTDGVCGLGRKPERNKKKAANKRVYILPLKSSTNVPSITLYLTSNYPARAPPSSPVPCLSRGSSFFISYPTISHHVPFTRSELSLAPDRASPYGTHPVPWTAFLACGLSFSVSRSLVRLPLQERCI